MPSALQTGLPRHLATVRLRHKEKPLGSLPVVYDVKFYPYNKAGVDPIFAAAGGVDTVICRPSTQRDQEVEILHWLKDDESDAGLNSCAWSRHEGSGDPLICVAGSSRKIKIINAITGKLHKTLLGHGAPINDLAVSPLSPNILASGSEDQTIRLWSLSSEYEKSPCLVICAGDAHSAPILSIVCHAVSLVDQTSPVG